MPMPTTSNNYFYMEIQDNGDDIVVTRGWDCGLEVCGKLTVLELNDIQTEALAQRNRQDGLVDATRDIRVAPRTGTFKPAGNGTCSFDMERWWWVRGVDVPASLPNRSDYGTAKLTDLAQSKPLIDRIGTGAVDDGDWDEDGEAGLSLLLTVPSGTRGVAQRDWNEFGPGVVFDGAQDFTVPANFDTEEKIFFVTSSMLDQLSYPTKDHTVRFIKLPDDLDVPTEIPEFVNFCRDTLETRIRTTVCPERQKK